MDVHICIAYLMLAFLSFFVSSYLLPTFHTHERIHTYIHAIISGDNPQHRRRPTRQVGGVGRHTDKLRWGQLRAHARRPGEWQDQPLPPQRQQAPQWGQGDPRCGVALHGGGAGVGEGERADRYGRQVTGAKKDGGADGTDGTDGTRDGERWCEMVRDGERW